MVYSIMGVGGLLLGLDTLC